MGRIARKHQTSLSAPLLNLAMRITIPAFLAVLAVTAPCRADPKPFPGTPTKWQGFARHDFKIEGTDAIVIVPGKPLPGRPWVWRGEFFDAFADADVALVKAGWHLAYLKTPDLFGSPKAMAKWEKFHTAMVNDYGMHSKPGLIGLSRGGLYCMNWAAAHPDKTLAAYDCKNDEEAIAYKLNPVDNLAPLAKAKIPLLLVYGDKDTVVPHAENSEVVFDRYKALGGPVEQIVKPGQDHHPHGLKDVTPVVKFFTDALEPKK